MGRLDQYSKEARQALSYAREGAKKLRQRLVGPEHILLGILKLNDPVIESICVSNHVSTARLRQSLEFVMGCGNKALLSEPSINAVARTVLARAEQEAAAMRAELIDVQHLLLGILGEREGVAAGVLESFGLSLDLVRQKVIALLGSGYSGREDRTFAVEYQVDATPTLNHVSYDLTMAAQAGTLDPLIGREAELERTMQILSRRLKNNPVLIGPAGVGKTAIAGGLAQRIVRGQVPDILRHCRVVALDVGLLTVGAKYRGDFEERLKRIMQEVINARGIILVIDELHTLVNTGVTEGSIDTAHLLKPMLARGEFQCIGATTMNDYHRTIEADPALQRRFQPVLVSETSIQETLEILQGLRMHYADFHHVTITDEALVAAVQMSSRYIQNRFQPDKAIDLLDEAAARVFVQRNMIPEHLRRLRREIASAQKAKDDAIGQQKYAAASTQRISELQLYQELCEVEQAWVASRQHDRPVVSEQHIAEVVTMSTGIPVAQPDAEEAERLLKLEDELHKRIIGQHEAVRAVAKVVRRSRTGLWDGRHPIGSFIFVGPTGVGKTELARAIAAMVLGDEHALIELDMSEFMESHHVSRLVGAPAGYVGYDCGGQLTEAVRRRPYCVVLFDKVEKAHPKILDLFLQILDDGCLTDSHGQVVDFRHTIIIMTSDVGMPYYSSGRMTFAPERASNEERLHTQIMSGLRKLFKPELLNRIDEIVFFHTLGQEQLHEIADQMIAQTQRRLAAQSIALQITDAARCLLVEHGYDPLCGARPLRRAVQRMLDDLLAEPILQGTVASGDRVVVDASNGRLKVNYISTSPIPS